MGRALMIAAALALAPLPALAQSEVEPSESDSPIGEPIDDWAEESVPADETGAGDAEAAEGGEPGEAEATPAPAGDQAEADAGASAGPGGPRVGRMPSVRGITGLFHIYSAETTAARTFGLALFGEFFRASDVVRQGDDDTRFTGRLSLSYAILDEVEAFISLSGSGNVNDLGEPALIQSQGDLLVGGKGFYPVVPGVSVGGSLALVFLNGENSVGVDFAATSMDLRALLSYSFEETRQFPLLAHLNLGYYLDNTPELFDVDLQRVERFAHGVSSYDQVELGLGFEVPLNYVTPSLEWNLGIPVAGDDLLDCSQQVIRCPTDAGFASYPDVLTVGIKGTPMSQLALNLAVDIGLTRQEATGLPTTPPYNVLFGLSYNLNPSPGPDLDEEALVVAEPTGWILGEVVDTDTSQPIPGAVVSYHVLDPSVVGAWTAQSTDASSGRFRSYEFPVGIEVEVEIAHPLYEARRFTRLIPEGEDGIRIRLQPRQNIAVLSGRVIDPAGEPLPATIYIGDDQYEVDPLTAEFSIEVEPGRYTLTAVAEGHVSRREALELAPGPTELELSLERLQEGQVAVLRGDRIDLSGERITFVDNGEVLDPKAEELLDQVAELLRQYPDIRLHIMAHGDDRTSVEMTERQAQAVLDYLVGQGIDASRLEAEGMGSERPIFPNISERNRARNRRVELLFAE